MSIEKEIVALLTEITELVAFAIEDIEFDDLVIGRGIFIIDYIGNHDRCNLKDIIANTRFPTSTSSRRVDELVKGGFVQRTTPSNDRRQITLQLTEKGELVFKLFREHKQRALKRILSSFSEKEVATFASVLRHLVEHKSEIFII